MAESVITECAGDRRDTVTRIYRYDAKGVRISNGSGRLIRIYQFDPSTGTITENDPVQPQKVLRRCVFDRYGMLEETFAYGRRPRTYRYEAGGQRIVMREGGDYGAVGKTYSFEGSGISETAFGRDGEIERVWVFDQRSETITTRTGGWFGAAERLFVCERIDVSVFRDPEAFLQFLTFTEKSDREVEAEIEEQVAKIRGEPAGSAGRSRYAYTGPRHTSDTDEQAKAARGPRSAGRAPCRSGDTRERAPAGGRAGSGSGSGIDFIPSADTVSAAPAPRANKPRVEGSGIPFEERFQSTRERDRSLPPGRSVEIPIQERFRGSREEDRTLSRGRSVEIPIEERFRGSREEDWTLSRGRSVEIPLEERFQGTRDRDRSMSRGRSAEIPIDERFQGSHDEDRTLPRGRSVDIPYEERKKGRQGR
jgi:hypothetical protein